MDDLGLRMALDVLDERMEEEADQIIGLPKGKHSPDRKATRHGQTEGYVIIYGKKVQISRPWVRTLDGAHEIPLPSYVWGQNEESLTQAAMRVTILGISQRHHSSVIDAVVQTSSASPAYGVSKSAISRRFVAGTQQKVDAFLARPLDSTRYLVLYVDGVQEGEHRVVAAMDLSEHGEKEILGLWEGTTENTTVCTALLEDLKRRGFSAERGILAVIDGGKALSAAVERVFGDQAVIQRCQVHKRRNVLEKLPAHEQGWVKRSMESAWSCESAAKAQSVLEALADLLESKGRTEAAASLREGLFRTLTCIRIGVDLSLQPTLTNTNALESAFSVHEACARRVKRWRNGGQVLRWVAMGLWQAEASFAPVGTSESLKQLADAIEGYVSTQQQKVEGSLIETAVA